MLFDLSVGGHHPGYIQNLIRYWCDQDFAGAIDVVVVPRFMELHGDVVAEAQSYPNQRINFVPLSADEVARLNTRAGAVAKAYQAFQEWGLLCQYARRLGTTHAVLMYLDTALVPFIFGQKPPCQISGIFFRPTFHYATFGHTPSTWKDRIQVWRERFNLSQILRRPELSALYCLDPLVVEHLDQFGGSTACLYLPDPVQLYADDQPDLEQFRSQLGIQPDRTVFLFFGALTNRKGIYQVLDAIATLTTEQRSKLCLLLVGPLGANPDDKQQMLKKLSELSDSYQVQTVIRDQFVIDREIQPYFQIADVILAPYQRHVGMSAILVRAAAAQKPVLSSDYGLMGEVTRRYGLGLTVDSADPQAIAQGVTRFLQEDSHLLCNVDTMRQFAEQNAATRFAETIVRHVWQAVVAQSGAPD
jgi:glycosyltransferase involved in cell wall biosynthesis